MTKEIIYNVYLNKYLKLEVEKIEIEKTTDKRIYGKVDINYKSFINKNCLDNINKDWGNYFIPTLDKDKIKECKTRLLKKRLEINIKGIEEYKESIKKTEEKNELIKKMIGDVKGGDLN